MTQTLSPSNLFTNSLLLFYETPLPLFRPFYPSAKPFYPLWKVFTPLHTLLPFYRVPASICYPDVGWERMHSWMRELRSITYAPLAQGFDGALLVQRVRALHENQRHESTPGPSHGSTTRKTALPPVPFRF